MYTITFSDGESLGGLRLEGGIFSKEGTIPKARVSGELGRVVIEGKPEEGEYPGFESGEHKAVRGVWYEVLNGRTGFMLEDIPAEELALMKAGADIEYLAMMSGVEL